jgi:hypothetical protein
MTEDVRMQWSLLGQGVTYILGQRLYLTSVVTWAFAERGRQWMAHDYMKLRDYLFFHKHFFHYNKLSASIFSFIQTAVI